MIFFDVKKHVFKKVINKTPASLFNQCIPEKKGKGLFGKVNELRGNFAKIIKGFIESLNRPGQNNVTFSKAKNNALKNLSLKFIYFYKTKIDSKLNSINLIF